MESSTEQLIQEIQHLNSLNDKSFDLERVKKLLQSGADPNGFGEGEEEEWLLGTAISAHRLDLVKVLVEAGAKVHLPDCEDSEDLSTPLEFAAAEGSQEIFDYLSPLTESWRRRCATMDLPLGIRQRATAENWKGDFTLKAAKMHLETVETLLSAGNDPNVCQSNGCPLLWTAAHNGHLDSLRTLVEFGADVNLANPTDGWSPLMVCVATHKPWLEGIHLAKWGLEIAQRVASERQEIVRLLTERGANVNAATHGGLTPLMAATHLDSALDMVKILVGAGANVNARDNAGRSVLCWYLSNRVERIRDWCIETENLEQELIEQTEIVRVLIEAGADINLKTTSERRAVDYARQARDIALHYARNRQWEHSAYMQVAKGYAEIIQLLLAV